VSAPRGHHLVAQLYLRGFARERRRGEWQALVVDRSTGERHVSNVRDIFRVRDWNTVYDEDGNRDYAVEELLAQRIDGPAAPVFAGLQRDEFPLGPESRRAMARFLSAQPSRGRHSRQALSEFITDVNRHSVALAAQHYTDEQWREAIGHVPTEEERQQLIHSEEHFDIKPTNAMLLETQLSTIEDVADVAMERTWTLVRFPEPCLFTSEHPVIYLNECPPRLAYGMATADLVYLPVSTMRALLMSHPRSGWPESVVHGSAALARKLNWAMLTFPTSERLLLHPDIEGHPLPGIAELLSM
jgi:hypothetical protein